MTEEEIKTLFIASWRLMAAYKQSIDMLPLHKKRAAEAKARVLCSTIDSHITMLLKEYEIKIVKYEKGTPYTPNYPMKAINADEFGSVENLVVKEMIEPALIKAGKVLHSAKVLLAQGENFDNNKETNNVFRD